MQTHANSITGIERTSNENVTGKSNLDRSVDEAIRRRLHLIPFTVTIPAEERGLDPPECVTTATNEYLDSQDKVGRWLEERCIVGSQESALSGKCWEDFKSWCEQGGEQAGSNKTLTDELTKHPGIRKGTRSSRGNVILGLSLKSDRPDEQWQDA